ncbi:MAG TPA: glycosyltransferase [Smithellaceae bacterium]|nr:glycosyltransferase [Smithellaceae bacterium]
MNDPLKKYRRQFRSWRNTRRLRREQEYYAQKFAQAGLSIPDEQNIERELKNKFPHLPAKEKGRLSIITLYHHYNWENEALKPSLEKFGRVRHYDWFDKFNHQDKAWPQTGKAQMNADLISQVDRWIDEEKADVIFAYLSGELVEPAALKQLRRHGIPMINLTLNDKEHFVGKVRNGRAYGARDICRFFDLCWTSTEDALIKYCAEGALPVYLPEGANPQVHRSYELEKTIDVSFVGQCYGNRQAVIDELKKRGIYVEAYGSGWPHGPLATEEMVKMYSRSKINLGFGGVSGHKDTFCLKGRDFEIPMSGGLYLTEDHPELHHVFQPGEEILTYSGIADLAAKINYYLTHPAEAEAIRKKGYERSRREHTWEMRFEKIFRLFGILK